MLFQSYHAATYGRSSENTQLQLEKLEVTAFLMVPMPSYSGTTAAAVCLDEFELWSDRSWNRLMKAIENYSILPIQHSCSLATIPHVGSR